MFAEHVQPSKLFLNQFELFKSFAEASYSTYCSSAWTLRTGDEERVTVGPSITWKSSYTVGCGDVETVPSKRLDVSMDCTTVLQCSVLGGLFDYSEFYFILHNYMHLRKWHIADCYILRNFKNATFYVDCFLYWVDLMLFPIQYFILSRDKQQLTIKRILLRPFILTLPWR